MSIKNLKISNWFKKNKNKGREYFSSLVEEGHGYSILKNSVHPCNDGEYNYEIALKIDNMGYMPNEVGEELDKIVNNPNSEYILGIHCTRNPDEGMIDKIFEEGLVNNGHLSSGAADGFTSITSTVEIFEPLDNELRRAISYIKAGRYGYGDRIVFKIPKSYLGKSSGEVKPIFYEKDGITRILPEYILGSLTVDENQVVSNFKFNPNYKDSHETLPTGFTTKMEPIYFANGEVGKYVARLNEYYKNINNNLYYNSSVESIDKFGTLLLEYQQTLKEKGLDQAINALMNLIDNNDASLFSNKTNLKKFENGNILPFIANQLGIKYIYDVQLQKLDIEEASKLRKQNNEEIIKSFIELANKNLVSEQQVKNNSL